MSDDTRTAPDATTTTAPSPPANNGEPRYNLTGSELAELLSKAGNDAAAKTRRAIESDPRISRARELERIYSTAMREPEPTRTEPAKPAASSRLEQMLEVLLASQIANLPKPPAPPAPEPVRPGDSIAAAQREATRGHKPGTPAFHAAVKEATSAALRKIKLRGG